MDISFINALLNILSGGSSWVSKTLWVFVSVEDPLILVAVTLSSHLDVEMPVIWGKIRIIHTT